MAFFLLPVVQSHAEHVHPFCRIATFKMIVTATLGMFFVDICLAFVSCKKVL